MKMAFKRFPAAAAVLAADAAEAPWQSRPGHLRLASSFQMGYRFPNLYA